MRRQLDQELQERDALADRIAAVLCERKKVGAQRRMIKEREDQIGIGERALARHYKLRGEPVRQSGESNPERKLNIEACGKQLSPELRNWRDHRIREINAAYEALNKP